MKSTIEFHREALDQALRIALGTSQPALRRQALARVSQHLIHPRLILESPLLTDSHPLHQEALLVSDAFEAVTNGMESPEFLEALEDLEPESPFQPWKHLILAIHFFYEGLDEAVMAHLGQIPEASPVRALVPVLRKAAGLEAGALSAAQKQLAELLAQPDPFLIQTIQDVAEGLEGDDEALFWAAFTDWVEPMAAQNPRQAQAAVLWVWNQLEWRSFDEAVLLDLGSQLWGRAESYRLAALGTLGWDAEGAALLWARYLVTAAREGQTPDVLEEARRWLGLFQEAAEEQSPSSLWRETWNQLMAAWNAETRAWSRPQWGMTTAEAPKPAVETRPIPTDGQLDLFA